VTAASEHSAPDRGRAETYLRLQAEAELRRALAMPAYKPPRERLPLAVAQGIVRQRRMQRRRAAVQRAMARQATTAGAPASRVPAPAARLLRSGSAAGIRLGRGLSGATWPLRRRFRRWSHGRGHQSPPAQQCAQRIDTLASILAAVGAISAETEKEVTTGFAAALAARGRIEPDALLGYHMFRPWPMRRAPGTQLASAGPLSAHPVGLSATGEIDGVPARFYLGVLVIDQGSVALTIQARLQAPAVGQHHGRHHHPMFDALNESSAVDDRGRTYDLHFSGGGSTGKWDGRLHLHPAPPAATRWLDMTLPGTGVLRIPTDAPSAELRIATAAVTTRPADRFLDAHTAGILARGPGDAAEILADDRCDLLVMAGDLLAAGVLTTSSEPVRRLAAVARHVGAPLSGAFADVESGDVPADWLSLLASAGRTDGPAGVIPIAAVLPEVDGALCVIAELVSDKDSATIQIHARGWPEPRFGGGVRIEQFWWSARDDLGGWYFVGDGGGSYGGDEADLELRFSPAIDPQARALDLILTGPSRQVVVTVPLTWQEQL
jgi:hypothetical protein